MLFLEAPNQILYETLYKRFNIPSDEKPEQIDMNGGDFDGCTFTVKSFGNDKEGLEINFTVQGGDELKKYGLEDEVKKFYGDLVAPTSKGATVTLKIPNVEQLDAKTKEKYLQDIPLLKRAIMTSPFKTAFEKFSKKEKFEAIRIPYRAEENIYIVNDDNKALIIVFSIKFRDMDDIVLAKVFLQELKDARRDRTLGNAPGVSFAQGQRPVELNNVKNVTEPVKLFDYGFVTMSLFNSHFEEKNRNSTIERLIVFRNYLHYHLKCSKAYMHIRMRDRVTSLLQNLEACKDNTGKVTTKKTATGRVFERK